MYWLRCEQRCQKRHQLARSLWHRCCRLIKLLFVSSIWMRNYMPGHGARLWQAAGSSLACRVPETEGCAHLCCVGGAWPISGVQV